MGNILTYNSYGKKYLAIFVVLTTIVWLMQIALVLPVRADHTTAHTIEQITAQIASLQSQLQTLSGSTTTTGFTFTQTLKKGSKGDEVKELQKIVGVTADGNFGLKTAAAVKEWQAANGLTADGIVGAKSRAKLNAMVSTTTTTTTTTTSPTSTTTVSPTTTPVAAGLTVSLAADTPAAGTVVADTTSGDGAQALAHFTHLKFDTASGTSAKVTTLKIKRTGISADSDLSNIYLYDGDAKVAENPTVSSTYYTFTNSNGIFTVSGSKTIKVLVDIANGTTSGKTIALGVNAASDVTTDATAVNGAYPIVGNSMSTATVSDLGKLTIAHISDPGTSIEAGLTDQKVWEYSLTAADQKIKISSIKLTAIGTIDASALTNLKLHDGTAQIGSTVANLASDKTVTFALAPYEITSGLVKNIQLRADIISGTGRDFYFEVATGSDIVATDANYNVSIKLNQADTFSIIKATNTTTVSAGSLTVTKRTDSPSGNIAKDALGITLAKYDFKAVGEAIKITSLTIRTTVGGALDAGNVDNGKILLDGSQIGTTTDLDSDATADGNTTDDDAGLSTGTDDDTVYNFGSSFVVNAGQTKVLSIVGDVKNGNGTAMAGNDTILITLEAGSSNAQRMSTGTSFNTAQTGANTLTVTAAALSATKNPSIANMTVVKGSTSQIIGSWLITAGSAEAMNVTSIGIQDQTDGAETWGDAFDALELYNGSTKLGSTINSPTATGNVVTQTFNLSSALNIPAGQSKQIDLKANVLSGATWTTDELDIDTMTGTGVTTSQTVTAGTNVVGQTVAVAANGTLTVANEATPTNPDSKYMVMGDTDQTVAAWKFSANNNEDLRVYRVVLKEVHADDVPGNVQNLKLYVDGVQVGATIPAMTTGTPDKAIFEDVTNGLFTVPKNGNKTLIAKVSATPFNNASVNVDGRHVQFRISNVATQDATTDISAKGLTSAAYATGAAGADFTANTHGTVRTKPTFALDSSTSTTLVPGNIEVYRFTISAHSANDVVFTSGTHNLRFTISESGLDTADSTADLFDAATNTTVATQLASLDFDTVGTLDFTTFGSTIPMGTSKTYYVKANLTDYATAGNSFQLELKNAAADMSFDDGQASGADIEEDNFTGIGLPLVGKIIVKP